jgi:parallel beta-helix repeat protein
MMKKCGILFFLIIIMLSVCLACVHSSNIVLRNKKIIYVDDDAPAEWYDNTHFKTIIAGIENVSDGDTVFVYNGTYFQNGNIKIKKSISLIGENKYSTIIDGRYIEPEEHSSLGASIVCIYKTNGVTVSGFTIQNVVLDTFMVDSGIFISNSSNNIIFNNIIRDMINVGIYLGGINHLVSENIIINATLGMWLSHALSSLITKNTITNIGHEGILLWPANGNTFIQNNITHARQGMVILESRSNLLKRNNIAYNTEGVFLSLSRRNKFYENNFIGSGYAGHVEFKGYSFFNRWKRNYWDNQIIHGAPKILFGRFGQLPVPWFNFDWRPARKPYDI